MSGRDQENDEAGNGQRGIWQRVKKSVLGVKTLALPNSHPELSSSLSSWGRSGLATDLKIISTRIIAEARWLSKASKGKPMAKIEGILLGASVF